MINKQKACCAQCWVTQASGEELREAPAVGRCLLYFSRGLKISQVLEQFTNVRERTLSFLFLFLISFMTYLETAEWRALSIQAVAEET